ncbi:hypothetical protein ASPSYDRAFT_399705 [Aspergillus sydowii CBS 593.65]|uniref:Uncharacterized protein n=1 Tax=Aspergillus sydowii CBS 593.65 TaxID=1036612 RepID=A0A1L9T9B7_9EURO|nr:uncharacterized protein ASPSYDRAFT_399705 [Aspergillus sydowii CBS 593.65]OJJ56029.1 hypothetical protein ASPSYDRAFT_399705 [Aspergillus sydowii CBS 593.65]
MFDTGLGGRLVASEAPQFQDNSINPHRLQKSKTPRTRPRRIDKREGPLLRLLLQGHASIRRRVGCTLSHRSHAAAVTVSTVIGMIS